MTELVAKTEVDPIAGDGQMECHTSLVRMRESHYEERFSKTADQILIGDGFRECSVRASGFQFAETLRPARQSLHQTEK